MTEEEGLLQRIENIIKKYNKGYVKNKTETWEECAMRWFRKWDELGFNSLKELNKTYAKGKAKAYCSRCGHSKCDCLFPENSVMVISLKDFEEALDSKRGKRD